MHRRAFLAALGTLAGSWSGAARAQHQAGLSIGYLGSESPDLFASRLRAFHKGLNEAGYAEGHNIRIEYRWADGVSGRFPSLVADLIRLQVAVIATPGSTPAALASKAATTTIPIVFAVGADPVQLGLVASLSHPGANVTGAASLNVEIGRKRFYVLKSLVPNTKIIGLLVNPDNPSLSKTQSEDAQKAAQDLGLQLSIVRAASAAELGTSFSQLSARGADALVITNDSLFISESRQLATLAARYAIPAIHQSREFAVAGGLVSYGGSVLEAHQQAGVYVGRILNGAKPADLPIAQSTRVEMVLNLNAAKMLRLNVPPSVVASADEVVE